MANLKSLGRYVGRSRAAVSARMFAFMRAVWRDEDASTSTIGGPVHKAARAAWRGLRGYLPQRLRSRLAAFGSRWATEVQQGKGDDWNERVKLNPGLLPPGSRSGVPGTAPSVRKDGMQDYPPTRPHITFEYIRGLVQWLAESDFQVISYNDLAGVPRFMEEAEEFRAWIARAEARGERAVLLQYDVDARPDVTMRLLEDHIRLGVPANVMVFNRKIFDWKLKRDGIVEIDDSYQLDFPLLERFQKAGGAVGYHCNAFDLAKGDTDKAIDLFFEDVQALRKHLDLRFFSMHGGHVTQDGRCNGNLPVHQFLEELGLTWVHNGHSVYFHRNWADGSASNPRYRNEANDPLDFIVSTRVGERTRLLFHPQYYNDFDNASFSFPVLSDQRWVEETRVQVERGGFDGLQYWRDRHSGVQRSIAEYGRLLEQPEDESPIFINGLSRSGTTLLASMFDAHHLVSMAYESYPRYLHVPSDDGVLTPEEYLFFCSCLINYPENVAFQLIDRAPLRNLRRFAAVSNWTGMSTREIGELVRAYLARHARIEGPQEALKVVAATARYKQYKEGTCYWGTKCQANFDDYFALWPQAKLVYILRHGLDVLASQKTNGSFNPDPKAVGRQWRQQYERFSEYKRQHPERTCVLLRYEDLVTVPHETGRRLCADIGIEFDPQMLRQHEVENTLVKNPRGQLSVDRIQQPIDQRSIGRWRDILSAKDVDAFLGNVQVRDLMKDFDYDWRL